MKPAGPSNLYGFDPVSTVLRWAVEVYDPPIDVLLERLGPPVVDGEELLSWALTEEEALSLIPGSSHEGHVPAPGLRWSLAWRARGR